MRVGVDLGGTKIEGVVLDDDLQPVWRERVATESDRGYEHILARVEALVGEMRARAPGCRRIGIGTPGSVSRRDGLLKNSNTICLNGRPLLEDLTRRLGLEVVVENDANCFALAESQVGAGRGARLLFGVILGTGVGGGIVVDGRLWTGPQHLGGEWGHHRIDPGGPVCYCGRRGCVETFLSGPAVERRYREVSGVDLPLAEVVGRAREGEVAARAVIDRFLDDFGRALANVVNILDPEVIVLGGGVSNIDELYTDGRAAAALYVFNDEFTTPIRRNALGDSAGVIGAALL
jgi:fructokinase